MHEQPEITVAICTHNRSRYLSKALDSLARQSVGATAFEVLVIDNASSDDTAAVIRLMQRVLPHLRWVREDRLGLSHARNRALDEATGTYIAYLDDDAIAAPDWVQALLAALRNVRPRPAAVGGPVYPIWLAPRPAWLGDRIRGCLTIVDWPGDAHFIDVRRQFIVGANMAFERAAIAECGGFDPDLGRIGQSLLGGEEILLQRRLVAVGRTVYYEPAASVRHHVHPERVCKRWFYRRYYWDGIAGAILDIRLRSLDRRQRCWLAVRTALSWLYRGRPHRAVLARDPQIRLATRLEALRLIMRVLSLLCLRIAPTGRDAQATRRATLPDAQPRDAAS